VEKWKSGKVEKYNRLVHRIAATRSNRVFAAPVFRLKAEATTERIES
jgi:hypothetical protein